MDLREYQTETLENVRSAYERGVHRAMVCLATGLGKTVIIAALPNYVMPRRSDAMVVLVNRDELVGQTIDKLARVHGRTGIAIEKAESRARGTERFVVASVQTLHAKRTEDFFSRFGDRIGVFVVDECHHATSEGYRRIIERFAERRPDGLLLGVTATPQRSDGQGLGAVFDEIVVHRDVQWAIENGYLVPLRCYKVRTNVSLDGIDKHGDDFPVEALGRTIDVPDRNDLIASAYLQHAAGRKAIAFCATVAQAEHLAQAFVRHGVRAAWASGKTDKTERARRVEAFRRGGIDVLVNCGIFVEGFDVPDAEVLIGARPTDSAALHIQITGRVLRPLDETAELLGPRTTAHERRAAIAASRKPAAMVLDIVDQTRRHSLRTLPTLWGLPPGLDAQGSDIAETAAQYKELAEKAPATARLVRSANEIATALEAIDAFAVPRQDPEIATISSLAWRMTGENRYRLPLPEAYEATNPDGSSIADFGRKYRARLAEAKRKGAYPFEAFAQQQIGYDPATLRTHREAVEIRPGILDVFEVGIERNGNRRVLGSTSSLHEAFTRAERWIARNRTDLVSALSASANWRTRTISPNQLKTLKTAFGVPLHLIPMTQGEASALIGKLSDERRTLGRTPPG